LNIIAVRIRQTAHEDKKKQFDSIIGYLDKNKFEHLILAGDFNHGAVWNEYDDSVKYEDDRQYYNYQYMRREFVNHSYNVNTPGFGEYPIKKYSWLLEGSNGYKDTRIKLDHLITTKEFNVNESELDYEWTNHSDHAMLLATIEG
jgi:endonuclease/exonuclease/phosphatase family metal-dependent hydrolase